MRHNLKQLDSKKVKCERMGRFNRQLSAEKMQVYQYPYQSRIQRQGLK